MIDRLATSGMPQPDDFAAMRQAGFDVVINLALPTSDHALPNGGELVSAQGREQSEKAIEFGTLPVLWAAVAAVSVRRRLS